MLKLSHDDNLNRIKKEISNFINRLEKTEFSLLNLAVKNIFAEIQRELDRFMLSRTDLTTTSIQVRNLFELYLIAKHIYSSEDGLCSWNGQLHKDSIDLQSGFMDLYKAHNQNVSELESVRKFTEQSFDGSPYKPESGFNIKSLAELYGYGLDYSAIHKLCSKLVHPTSIKINAYSAFTDDDTYLAILQQAGVFFCHRIEDLIHEISFTLSVNYQP